jgi:hypothetical protein
MSGQGELLYDDFGNFIGDVPAAAEEEDEEEARCVRLRRLVCD